MPKPQPKKAAKKAAAKTKAKASKPTAKAKAQKPAPKPVVKKKPAAKASKPAAKTAAKTAAKVLPKGKAKAAVNSKAASNSHAAPNSVNADGFGQRPKPVAKKPVKMTPFLKQQKQRLMALRDSILDSMAGVAKDTLRSRPEGSEASAFGMHQADAGSDAYDKDFALSLLSQEQDALYEVEEALKRVDNGTYGVCEMSAKQIPHPRLEALPFARFTVECQTEVEKGRRFQRSRIPVTSLFGLTDSEGEGESETEEAEETPAKQQEE